MPVDLRESIRLVESGFSRHDKQFSVIPAKAGIQDYVSNWIPAFAGMTRSTKGLVLVVVLAFRFRGHLALLRLYLAACKHRLSSRIRASEGRSRNTPYSEPRCGLMPLRNK